MLDSISEWETYLVEGKQFYFTAKGSMKKRAKFTPVIVYNIISMCIEKYIMGYMMKQGKLPENHTLGELLLFLMADLDIDPEVARTIKNMDRFQEICSTETYSRKEMSWEEIETFMAATDSLIATLNSTMEADAVLS